MDIVYKFPTLCFKDLLLHNKLSQNTVAWNSNDVLFITHHNSLGWLASSALSRAHCTQLVVLLGWLGLSLQMIFHVNFSTMVSGFPEGKPQCSMYRASAWITFFGVLLAKAWDTAKSIVHAGENYTGQDVREVWFTGSHYLPNNLQQLCVHLIKVWATLCDLRNARKTFSLKKIPFVILSGKYSVSFHWIKAVAFFQRTDRCLVPCAEQLNQITLQLIPLFTLG